MTWVIIIIAIVGYYIFSFSRDRNKMLERQVDIKGGMAIKYEYLINRLTNYPSSRVIKLTRDHIHIRATEQHTSEDFLITEVYNSVVIEWVAQLAMMGTHKNKWTFPHNYPQEKMYSEIEEFIEWKTKQIFNK